MVGSPTTVNALPSPSFLLSYSSRRLQLPLRQFRGATRKRKRMFAKKKGKSRAATFVSLDQSTAPGKMER